MLLLQTNAQCNQCSSPQCLILIRAVYAEEIYKLNVLLISASHSIHISNELIQCEKLDGKLNYSPSNKISAKESSIIKQKLTKLRQYLKLVQIRNEQTLSCLIQTCLDFNISSPCPIVPQQLTLWAYNGYIKFRPLSAF